MAEQVAGSLEEYLGGIEGVNQAVVAGSYRRRQETVGDLDAVASSEENKEVMERFVEYEDVDEVLSEGEERTSVMLRSGLQVDLRVVPEKSFGTALLYFTGSQHHHVTLRDVSLKRDLKFNEYRLFRGDKQIAGKTEEEIYQELGFSYIEPELRENRGELEAAQDGMLPKLITEGDIRGNLHAHTDATDGNNTPEEMARAAKDRGYDYFAITDHSRRLRMVNGLDEKRLREQMEEIDCLNDELTGITLLKGIEVDILEDGSLDLPDDVLGLLGAPQVRVIREGADREDRAVHAEPPCQYDRPPDRAHDRVPATLQSRHGAGDGGRQRNRLLCGAERRPQPAGPERCPLQDGQGDEEDLKRIDEVGPVAASSLATFFADRDNRRTVEEMKQAGLDLPNPDYGGEAAGPLKDLSIVFTGRLQRWSRSDAESLVESLGGRTPSDVSGNTDYVVAGPDAGTKLDEARERSVPVMNEDEFASFLQDRGVESSREG